MSATQIPKTYSPKASEIERKWWIIDAEGLILGRMASEAAKILQGKHKAMYVPHLDCGDYVIVLNAEKAVFTGDKKETKIIYRHSGFPGGLKTKPYSQDPAEALRQTIRKMLPKTRLGNQMLKKLMVYEGSKHLHTAQNPQPLEIPSAIQAPASIESK